MPEILTVTLNPAIDVAMVVDKMIDTHKLRGKAARRDPGGGGINVARVLHRLRSHEDAGDGGDSGDCAALYFTGGAVGQELAELLDAEQVCHISVPIAEETRENLSVRETSTGKEYRFVMPGPTISEGEWAQMTLKLDVLLAADVPPRYLVLSGDLPPGLPADAYVPLVRAAHRRDVRVVLDTSSPALAHALNERVFLVKPSLRELGDLVGQPLADEAAWRAAAQRIVDDGRAEIVALTLGDAGALVVTRTQALRVQALPMPVSSAIGAGDSFVAGMIWALHRNESFDNVVRYALATASATLLAEGTALCRVEDVERLYRTLVH